MQKRVCGYNQFYLKEISIVYLATNPQTLLWLSYWLFKPRDFCNNSIKKSEVLALKLSNFLHYKNSTNLDKQAKKKEKKQ